jgi:hypothetical protein
VEPDSPLAGHPVALIASAFGRGVAYAWDLDGDGAFDDATGERVTTAFNGATARVAVRATDEAGRTATETRTFQLHAFNTRPSGTVELRPPSARVGRPVTVKGTGFDPDGRIAKVELDLDGDGTFDTAAAEAATTYVSAGERTVRARFTDDAGGTAVASATLDVHAQDLPPSASLQVAQANGSFTSGGPVLAGGALVTGYGSDPDATVARIDFDSTATAATRRPAARQSSRWSATAPP